MVDVSFSEISETKLHFLISGHCSNNKGNDIVCAAVSALAQTFLRGIELSLNATFAGDFKSGDCNLLIEVPKDKAREFKIICEIFKNGFHEISKSYPERVNLISQEIYHGS